MAGVFSRGGLSLAAVEAVECAFRKALPTHFGIVCSFALCFSVSAMAVAETSPGRHLKVQAAHVMPIPELSALDLSSRDPEAIHGIAAGDAEFQIVRFGQDASIDSWRADTENLRILVGGHPGEASQWEAVASDGAGNVCLLAEVSSRILCLDKELKSKLATIDLDVSPLHELSKSWKDDPNSRGEGLLLMKQGHLLLLKEKRPSLLVEFGPEGEAPVGFGADTVLAGGESFAVKGKTKLAALKVWTFAASLAALARDASDIALGPDGRLYLLSDESAVVVRLEGRLKPSESKVRESAFWKLPHELVKPEGLAIDKNLRPWIVIDQKQRDRPTLFQLTPLANP